MLGLRISLFSRIMLWFFLNLLVLAAIFLLIFGLSFRFEPGSPFFGGSANRIDAVARLIEGALDEKTHEERDEVLARYSEVYKVDFFFFDNQGNQLGGRPVTLPENVFSDITRPEGFGPGPRGPNQGANRPPGGVPPPGPGRSVSFKSSNPTFYWLVVRTLTFGDETGEPMRTRLIVRSDSFYGYGLFYDPRPWIGVAAIVVVLSILFWLPFVRNITRAIGRMTGAARQIAAEDFSVRVDVRRTDELGRLGLTINDLAKRLGGFVSGQKRFLGDISHELNSPLARMQFALSILEESSRPEDQAHITDIREEVELMSKLVGELLSYSKSGIQGAAVKLERVNIRELVESVVLREAGDSGTGVEINIDEGLAATAQPELLYRAVANIVRNSVAHTTAAGKIVINGLRRNGDLVLTIDDDGPCVPDEMLEKIFDPLFRVEDDRSRNSGGTGLGLAIVKTCIEACDGRVYAENASPHGLSVVITLKNAPIELRT